MFCGHTHETAAWALTGKGECRRMEAKDFKLRKGWRYIVNVGSVGYPRHEPFSAYVIWDAESDRVTFRRLPFDFKGYARQMLARNVDLPGWLSARLA